MLEFGQFFGILEGEVAAFAFVFRDVEEEVVVRVAHQFPVAVADGGESLRVVAQRVASFTEAMAAAPGVTVAVSHVSDRKSVV